MMEREHILSILYDIKTAGMFSSLVIMTYTCLSIILYGRITWTEPNNLILYSEMLFLVLSWVGWIIQKYKVMESLFRRKGG